MIKIESSHVKNSSVASPDSIVEQKQSSRVDVFWSFMSWLGVLVVILVLLFALFGKFTAYDKGRTSTQGYVEGGAGEN